MVPAKAGTFFINRLSVLFQMPKRFVLNVLTFSKNVLIFVVPKIVI